ncbi:MAG TPA: hypothetical protein P5268_05135 [Candidatus Marinimicrobia bacterium]|nr:hypothetical protein [Candidatus Neomarinimicrobiota bacterium]HRU92399.1 hypothetical protein [Candidatus Neomarinimicrobiota bacterium]
MGNILVLTVALNAQIADFSGERLTFTIHPKFVEMSGKYYFSNRTGQVVNLPIVYPFCINSQQAFPDSIAVGLEDSNSLPFEIRNESLYFSVPLKNKELTAILIYFRQPVTRPQFEYILTSTRSWQKPLEFADFTIQVPFAYRLTNLSFPYEKIDTVGNFQVYHLYFENFYPDKNLIFSW